MSAFETADLVATVITVPFFVWYGCTYWAYWVPPLKKEAKEKTGIEIPLPDSLWRASLNLVLAPVSDMWTQYWAIEWSVFGVLVHALLVLFLGSLFKTQAKDAQWLLLRVFGYLGTSVSWMFEFISTPSTPAVAPATKKTAPDAPAAPAPAAPAAPAPAAPAAKKVRAASARAKSPRAKAPKKTGINVGDSVLARHADGHKYPATVTAINGASYVIAWQDDDPTDTVKTLKEMKLLHDE